MAETKPSDAHHHGNLKEALVSYTLSAADNGGLSDLSVRKAARDLGVSPGAAYRHFPDKNALLRTVASLGFDALAETFEHAVPFDSSARDAKEARARFVKLALAYSDFAHRRRELWRLMFGPLGRSPSLASGRPSTYEWLGKCLIELASFGIIKDPQPEDQFFAWSAIHGLSDLQRPPTIADPPQDALVERHCAFVIAALSQESYASRAAQ
ncbi:MAG: TetR/AcrR family transcriptional regulator [Pseudomonadota bacterium]